MKKIILFFLLFFTFPTLALSNEITSAQIDRMYIGESLLNFYTKEEIENAYNYDDLPSDMKFRITEIEANMPSPYEVYQFYHVPDDKGFIIHGIRAAKFCKSKKECEVEFNKMDDYLSTIFDNVEKIGPITESHIDDPSGKSKYTVVEYNIPSGNVSVNYTNWSNKVIYDDNVSVSVYSKDVEEWVRNDYGLN